MFLLLYNILKHTYLQNDKTNNIEHFIFDTPNDIFQSEVDYVCCTAMPETLGPVSSGESQIL